MRLILTAVAIVVLVLGAGAFWVVYQMQGGSAKTSAEQAVAQRGRSADTPYTLEGLGSARVPRGFVYDEYSSRIFAGVNGQADRAPSGASLVTAPGRITIPMVLGAYSEIGGYQWSARLSITIATPAERDALFASFERGVASEWRTVGTMNGAVVRHKAHDALARNLTVADHAGTNVRVTISAADDVYSADEATRIASEVAASVQVNAADVERLFATLAARATKDADARRATLELLGREMGMPTPKTTAVYRPDDTNIADINLAAGEESLRLIATLGTMPIVGDAEAYARTWRLDPSRITTAMHDGVRETADNQPKVEVWFAWKRGDVAALYNPQIGWDGSSLSATSDGTRAFLETLPSDQFTIIRFLNVGLASTEEVATWFAGNRAIRAANEQGTPLWVER